MRCSETDPPQRAHQVCDAFDRFSRIFPVGRPAAWLVGGRYQWLSGHAHSAHRTWQRSLASAARLAMLYDQGLAHYEIGRHSAGGRRRQQLRCACEIFDRLGATYDLACARAEAERSS